MKTEQEIAEHYAALLAEHGPTYRAGDNGSRASQTIRHDVLAELIASRHARIVDCSVLDVGCGIGDFLADRTYNSRSEGWDISPTLVEIARGRIPALIFQTRDLMQGSETEAYDYVVASGLFQFRPAGYLREAVTRMYRLARTGVAFNFLTLSDGTIGETAHDAIELASWCAAFCDHVTLRRDYLPNDATIYLRKR